MSARSLLSALLLAAVLATSVTAVASAGPTRVTHKKKRKRTSPPVVCTGTTLIPSAENLELVRTALDCLHDQARAQHGLRPLKADAALKAAAAGHTDDMLARGYFEHDSPEGETFADRILAAGYARPGQGWSLGENLAWGTDTLATPAALMAAWLESEGHRANILDRRFRELGLAVRLGTPTGAAGVTISAEFGALVGG
jgi:uncharacterized protein YkwD